MKTISVSREIDAPVEVLWQIMTDLDSFEETISAIESVESLSGGDDFDIGTKWRETRTMFGKQATEVMWVTEIDPGRSYVVNAESHGSKYTTKMSLMPQDNGSCLVTMDFGAEAVGTMAKLMTVTIGRFFENATKKAFAQDLNDIATVAEAVG